jgi:hypothetical protein
MSKRIGTDPVRMLPPRAVSKRFGCHLPRKVLRVLRLTTHVVVMLGCVAALAGWSWGQEGPKKGEARGRGEERSGIPDTTCYGTDRSNAKGSVLFYLDDFGHTEERVALLEYVPSAQRDRVRIVRCQDGRAETVYALDEPGGESWTDLESFPSNGLVPGVVVWGSTDDYSHTGLIVICYTGSYWYPPSGRRVEKPGIFKVAFNGGYAMLVDLDLDGIPEVVANLDSPKVEVWTYIAGAYVKVGEFPKEALWSEAVRRAIGDAKRKHGEAERAVGAGSRVPGSK